MWVLQPSQASSDILIHYGVPGMKWGVRKTERQKGNYRRFTNKDYTLSTNHKLYRSAAKKHATFKGRPHTYITTNEYDRDLYANNMDSFGFEDKVIMELKAKKPLRIAGQKQAMAAALDAYGSVKADSDMVNFAKKVRVSRLVNSNAFNRYLDKHYPKSDITKVIETVDIAGSKSESSVVQKYTSALKTAGYDGAIDLMDIGWDANEPTIIFNPENKLTIERLVESYW